MNNPPLTCPLCEDQPLNPTPMEAGLKAHQCVQCRGRWVHGPDYLDWLASRPAQAAADAGTSGDVDVVSDGGTDSDAGKLCLYCVRFMRRLRVGHGTPFHLDRCASCGGFWFDAGEWESLKAQGMHREAHLVFTDAWQAVVRRQARDTADQKRLTEHLGEDGLKQADSIRDWIASHPHGNEILARILDEG